MGVTAVKNDTEFVSVKHCARVLGVSEATVRRRIDDGLLKGYRLAGVRRVFASELARITGERKEQT